ncbi:hypothetical protein NT6N_00990 [Oceaniferula spumae]|uniref:ATPase dynein-related AAA domain-containing protein n=1 Tax=Oceaniferula spumae TaxID=2979115 RepID=A0AAT9FGG8_9BACT
MQLKAPKSVMIYEIKGKDLSALGQRNYQRLLSSDKDFFYWNKLKFSKLKIGDAVFVVNKTGREILHAELDATGIPTEYSSNENKTTFNDSDQVYEVGGEWDSFVRMKVLKAVATPPDWSWKSLGSSQNTYLLGDHVSVKSKKNNILRARQLRDLPDMSQPSKELLKRCIMELEGMATDSLPTAPKLSTPRPSKDMLDSQFVKDASEAIRKSGLVYPDGLLQRFICSLLAKPFAILTGTSGTGKTIIAQSFAKWLVGEDHYALVAVGADWTDNRQIVGHYNPFEEQFTSTRALELLLRASANPTQPHFLILDEMNLSQVERYFADFLSAMESKGAISLHNNGNEIVNAHGSLVEERITIPRNLFVIGTVNIDETTHMFSPKVLDRANVIEFSMVSYDLSRFLKTQGEKPTPLSTTTEDIAIRFLNTQTAINTGKISNVSSEDTKVIHKVILETFKLLEGSGMEFGFRVPSEVMRYCEASYILNPLEKWKTHKVCDEQILQKILPKLHGSRRKIERILVALASYCKDQNIDKAKDLVSGKTALTSLKIPEDSEALSDVVSIFPKSYAKLVHMIIAVRRDQFVSFVQ